MEVYLSVGEVAKMLNVPSSTVSVLKMPEPDAMIGKTRGWKREAIEEFAKTRRTRTKK